MHICLFFVANSQTTCMNTERSRVNDEFFVHLQCKVLETQRLHQILLIKAELEASFNEQEVSKYYFNRHFNDQEILTFLSECHHHSLSYSTLLQQQGNEGENMSQITGRMMGHWKRFCEPNMSPLNFHCTLMCPITVGFIWLALTWKLNSPRYCKAPNCNIHKFSFHLKPNLTNFIEFSIFLNFSIFTFLLKMASRRSREIPDALDEKKDLFTRFTMKQISQIWKECQCEREQQNLCNSDNARHMKMVVSWIKE